MKRENPIEIFPRILNGAMGMDDDDDDRAGVERHKFEEEQERRWR